MTSLNISLPESLRTYVEEQVQNGGYGTVSEFLRELIRQDQQRKAQAQLETLLLQGLASGDATPMTEEDWVHIRQEVRERATRRNAQKRRA